MKRSLVMTAAGLLFLLLLVSCNWGNSTPTPITIKEGEAECLPVTPADGAETILIPSGSFRMGSLETNDNAADDEFPEHEVALTCYNIYKDEVTNSMYDKCVQAGECFPVVPITGSLTEHYADPEYANKPAVGIDYNMASEYCEWIGGRLPTEAEWEYAATSSEEFIFPWGNEAADCEKANFAGCLDPADTVEIGSLTDGESPFGVQDMAGNAWEWVFDWYDPEYYAVSPSSNPSGPSQGETKAVRGGAYNSDLHLLLAANRHAGNPYRAYNNTGFRCVIGALTLPEDYQDPIPEKHDIPGDTPLNGGPDPEWYVAYMPHPLDCPDGNGDQHLWMTLSSNVPISIISVALESSPMTCAPYDDVNDLLHCWIPQPAPDADPNYLLDFCVDVPGYGPLCFNCVPLPKPQNCGPGQQVPSDFSAINYCEFNNIVPVEFTFDPAIFWNTVENTAGDALTCFYNSPNKMTCSAPIVLDNGLFRFHLEGTYGATSFVWNPVLIPIGPCSSQQNGPFAFSFATCDTTGLMLMVQYSPQNGVLGPVTVGQDDLQCTAINPGEATCYIPDFYEGSTEQATVCVDGECVTSTTPLPVCADLPSYGVVIASECHDQGVVGINIAFNPAAPDTITQITANGTALYCVEVTPQNWACKDLPGQPGDLLNIEIDYVSAPSDYETVPYLNCQQEGDLTFWAGLWCQAHNDLYVFDADVWPFEQLAISTIKMEGQPVPFDCFYQNSDCFCRDLDLTPGDTLTFEVCYADNTCRNFVMTVPTCGQQCFNKFYEVECVNENTISFIVDVCVEDPKPLLAGSVSGTDGTSNYACSLHPSILGRFYCQGPHPITPADGLHYYYKYESYPGSWVGAFTLQQWLNKLPGCQTPTIDCTILTTEGDCKANGCNPIYTGGNTGAAEFVRCENP